jgi:hypothetical protein
MCSRRSMRFDRLIIYLGNIIGLLGLLGSNSVLELLNLDTLFKVYAFVPVLSLVSFPI